MEHATNPHFYSDEAPSHSPLHAARTTTSYSDTPDRGHLNPLVLPPAGAPPTPPPTPPAWKERFSAYTSPLPPPPPLAAESSYQHSGGRRSHNNHDDSSSTTSGSGRRAQTPVIRYEDELEHDQPPGYDNSTGLNSFRGDASLRPNVGRTNSYEYALFGWTLEELVGNLRIANLAATFCTLLWVLFSWVGKLLFLQLHQLVLLGYLAILTASLFLVEVMGYYRQQLSSRGDLGSTHTSVMEERLRDQLGLLFHPAGKAAYLFFLAILCWAMDGLMLGLIGGVYACSALGYVYAFNTYPEFRRAGATPRATPSSSSRSLLWKDQAWTTGQGLAAAMAARNWSTRWGLGTGPGEDTSETQGFVRHNQANQSYTYV
jgi:hypothetical protein